MRRAIWILAKFGLSRRIRKSGGCPEAKGCPLEGTKGKGLVLLYRPAHTKTKLVALEHVLLGGKEVSRIKDTISQILEGGAV